jgi:hypothetical protein
MIMKKNTRTLNLVLILIISLGCGIPASNPDKFYFAWADWGVPRFPLIKPYDVSFLGKNENWVIALHSSPTQIGTILVQLNHKGKDCFY